jgi:hypothetical protein
MGEWGAQRKVEVKQMRFLLALGGRFVSLFCEEKEAKKPVTPTCDTQFLQSSLESSQKNKKNHSPINVEHS